ncbi:MAG: hypothetical protein KH230_07175 [Enterocloster asparagiformis]|nr:hypothetical protein [Enterocloster asparagiformis]
MEEKQKKRRKYLRLLLLAAVLLAAAGAVYGYCGYKGYIVLNHPSRHRYPVRGVDVSHYQGDIDWDALERQRIEFAYIKATEGSGLVDDRFAENWDKARAAGVKAGAYHFFSFDSPAQGQLENFIRTVPAYREMLPPTVDFEFYGDKHINPPDVEATEEQLKILLDGLEAQYGVKPVIYAARDTWKMYIKGRFDEYPLWIRSVVTRPFIGKETWTFWQYSNRGRLEGYTGGEKFIDLDVFGGSRREWEEWSGSYGRALDARGTLEETDGFGLLVPQEYRSERQGDKLVVTREQSEESYRMLRLKVSAFPIPGDLGELPAQRSAWCLKTGMDLTCGSPLRVKRYGLPEGGFVYRAAESPSMDWRGTQTLWFFFGEERIYAVEEAFTADSDEISSFSDFIREGRVFLDGKAVRMGADAAAGVFWQEAVSEEQPVWLETEKRESGGVDVRVYCARDLVSGQPANTFSYETEDVGVWMDDDVNFDGCRDLSVLAGESRHVYLWDSGQGRADTGDDYGPLLYPLEGAGISLDSRARLIELRYSDREGRNGSVYGLARWQGDQLILLRRMEFPAQDSDDPQRAFPVRVVDFPGGWKLDGPFTGVSADEGVLLFDAQWTKAEYEEKKEAVEQAFYEGLPFESDFFIRLHSGEADYGQSLIPQSLRDYIRTAMEEGNEKEALLALRESEALTPVQVKSEAARSPGLDRWVREIAVSTDGAAAFVKADGDGDGVEDISAEIYLGGTGGFTQFVFFKGQPDGSFRETSCYDEVQEEFAYVGWEGRPYLIRTSYDYGAKLYDGFNIYAYRDGQRAGALRLELAPEEFSVKTESVLPGYEAPAEAVSQGGLSAALDTSRWPYEQKVVLGSAETDLGEGMFSSDVFNCGEPVEYDKYNWYSSNMYTRDGVSSSLFAQLPPAQWSEFTGDVMMFWVEKTREGNVVCFFERDALMDYAVSGWRFDGDEARNVFRIKWTGRRGVREQALRRQHNL